MKNKKTVREKRMEAAEKLRDKRRNHYTVGDTFDLRTKLAATNAAGIRKFIEVLKGPNCIGGFPVSMYDEIGVNLEDYKDQNYSPPEEVSDRAYKKWLEILGEMVFAFEYDEFEGNEHWDAYADSIKHIGVASSDEPKTTTVTITADDKLEKLYNDRKLELDARCENGLRLFAKYFLNLWW